MIRVRVFLLCFLPCTVKTAVVFWSPHTQVYSPASCISTWWTVSSAAVPCWVMVYLSPALSRLCPFFHTTGVSLLSSQRRATVPSSATCSSFNSSLKNGGRAEGQKAKRSHEKHPEVRTWQKRRWLFSRARMVRGQKTFRVLGSEAGLGRIRSHRQDQDAGEELRVSRRDHSAGFIG